MRARFRNAVGWAEDGQRQLLYHSFQGLVVGCLAACSVPSAGARKNVFPGI